MKIEKQKDITQVTHTDGSRFYEKDGNKYPSVTTICGIYPKSEYFWRWKFTNPDAQKIFKEAGVYGSKVHETIEHYINSYTHDMEPENYNFDYTVLTEKEKKSIQMFIDWFKKINDENEVEVISCETMVINHEHKYAGTVDLILKINKQLWIVDVKTSKAIWPSHRLQLSAYRHAMINTDDYKLGIIHINHNQSKYGFKEIDDIFDVFLSVKRIFEYEQSSK